VAKAASWTGIDAEARKPGEQTGLDTPVVLALNDECLVWFEPHGTAVEIQSSFGTRVEVLHGCRPLVS